MTARAIPGCWPRRGGAAAGDDREVVGSAVAVGSGDSTGAAMAASEPGGGGLGSGDANVLLETTPRGWLFFHAVTGVSAIDRSEVSVRLSAAAPTGSSPARTVTAPRGAAPDRRSASYAVDRDRSPRFRSAH